MTLNVVNVVVLPSLHCRLRSSVAAFVVFAALLVGCPHYEEEHSGHYREVDIDELQDEAVALDLFRFGDNIQAVLRHYDISSSAAREVPFDPSNQTHCRWSDEAQFDDETRRFSLVFHATTRMERVEIDGEIEGDGQLSLVIDDDGIDEPRQIELAANEDSPPNAACTTIDDFLLRPIFDDEKHLDPDAHQLRNPVFTLLWVGVQPEVHDGVLIYVGLNRTGPSVRLAELNRVDFEANTLTGDRDLAISLPPPPEQILVESGDTRYALGHFLVIDDSEDEEGSFSWDVDNEPLIGSSLEDYDHLPEDTPEHFDINGWGKAMFFVEGNLDELHNSTRAQLEGIEDAVPNRHFYIVDIFFYNEEVKVIRLPHRPRAEGPVQSRVPVQLTDRYLGAGDVPVPRLFPYN